MPPHFFGSKAIGRLGCIQLFPKMNFQVLSWISFICVELGAISVAVYQILLRIRDLQTNTLPAKVRDLRYPSSAIWLFIAEIFLSQVLLLFCSFKGKVYPRVVRGVLGGCRVKGVVCMGG